MIEEAKNPLDLWRKIIGGNAPGCGHSSTIVLWRVLADPTSSRPHDIPWLGVVRLNRQCDGNFAYPMTLPFLGKPTNWAFIVTSPYYIPDNGSPVAR